MELNLENIRKILYKFANLEIKKNIIEYDVLYKLLENHPKADEKIGVGVDCFFVQQSKFKKNQYNFMIRRVDGSTTDFSFMKCLHPKRKLSKNKNWSLIFRWTIKDQIDSFRDSAFGVVGKGNMFVCSETNLKFNKIYSHVDHVYPLTFDSIFLEFIKINNIDLDKIELSDDLGTSEVQKILDKKLVKSFSNFHKKRSVLRIVCSAANLQAKKTKDYVGENPVVLRKALIKKYPQYHLTSSIND